MRPPSSPAMPDERFTLGKYEVMKRLATGGMAEIYLARVRGITGFEKIVVPKRILPQLATQPDFVRMFLDEARIAATLQHPNIVQTYDVGAEGGDYFMAMEYLHGEDLRSLMKTLRGRKQYFQVEHAIRVAMDVCAVAILLFELVMGKRLYRGASEFDVLKRIVEGDVPSPRALDPAFPVELDRIIVKGLQKDPEKRFQTAREMGQALEAFAHAAHLQLSTMALAAYMEDVFGRKIEAWREAQAQGKDLGQHLVELEPGEIALLEGDLVELDEDDPDAQETPPA